MSATNKTTNYEFPVFIGTDKPAWLVDWNSAMNAIDTAIKQAETKADQAGTDVGSIQSDIITINSSLTTLNSAVSQLRIDTNANTGAINTIQELIGNGTPTTTDQTLIGAINELNNKKFNISELDLSQATIVVTPSVKLSNTSEDLHVLINSDGSIGKIYGYFSGSISTALSANDDLVTIKIPGLNTTEAYDISGYVTTILNGTYPNVLSKIHFNVGDTVSIKVSSAPGSGATAFWINLPPCLLFFKDLGD